MQLRIVFGRDNAKYARTMPDHAPDFELTADVRDYECDLQGVVNNAGYPNSLAPARHGPGGGMPEIEAGWASRGFREM